ncbi:MAG: ABC transporter ATP-binding protein [Rhodococcus sp. (in: high G+C Gram-positive bacteria)]|uniref:ABC transporter ATP-binding protein n=1 Tax=Rhodococcus sp. TaxID=1831 RepID=UPI003BB6E71E
MPETTLPETTLPETTLLPDPLHLATYRRQLSVAGNATLTRALILHVVAGICEGLALLSLLPISTVLVHGGTAWGLTLGGWLVLLSCLAAATFVLRYVEEMAGYTTALDFIRVSHRAIGDHLARLPLGWFTASRTGGLSRLVSDGFMSAAAVLAHMLQTVVVNAVALVTLVVGAWFWDPRLGVVFTVTTLVAVVVMRVAQRIKRAGFALTEASDNEMANRVVEYAVCQPALRASGRADRFAPLEQAGRDNHAARVKDLWWSTGGLILNGLAVQAIVVALIAVSANLAVGGDIDPIETIAFVGITLRLTRILDELGGQSLGLESGRTPLREIRAILDSPVLPEPASTADRPEPGAIEFDRVTFGYNAADPVLHEVSFRAEPGTMTALVGRSGSGKTTVARLISRFWDVRSGTVSVGGADIRSQRTEDLMDQLSMVFQDVYLFDDTLEANVRVGRPDATDDEVHEAATRAGVTAIAERLPDGWQTRVGEGGRSLSGGERQRVSIARALLKRAPIVLFDEATSALDAENEANVLASMDRMRKQSTFIVVAHRLDTIRQADNILVLDDGRIVEHGTHADLFAAGGHYRHFWDRRAAAAGWSLRGGAAE